MTNAPTFEQRNTASYTFLCCFVICIILFFFYVPLYHIHWFIGEKKKGSFPTVSPALLKAVTAMISFPSCPTSHCQSVSKGRCFIASADGRESKNSLIFRSQMDFRVQRVIKITFSFLSWANMFLELLRQNKYGFLHFRYKLWF